METGFNIWQVVAGIGIFLIGIQMLETSLKNMMSRPFKLYLRKQTGNPFKAILGGTIVTAVLQSSSAVNFMVLAFVSTGVITMRNAFAVIMGTNLGTTLDSWIIAGIGFNFDIESFAYPIVGIAGLILFIRGDMPKVRNICSFLIGFSFLFIGLGLMKSAVENETIKAAVSNFAGRSNLIFLLIGFISTTITQSSSATVAITLSILNQQLIGFDSAIAAVIGSEVGTSLKLILGSLDGIAAKKRVAVGNLLYNLVTTFLGLIFLEQIAYFITDIISIRDPLIGLVTFQSGINLLNIVLFLPFLNPFSRFLEKLFSDKDEHVSAFIYKTKPAFTVPSFDLLQKETEFFIYRSFGFTMHAFDLVEMQLNMKNGFEKNETPEKLFTRPSTEQYEMLKKHQGEIQTFYIALIKGSVNEKEVAETDRLIASVRSCMHAVKCVKDIQADLYDLKNSSHDIKYDFYRKLRSLTENIYRRLLEIQLLEDKQKIADELIHLLEEIQLKYKENLHEIYNAETIHTISHLEISTLININRELFTSHKAMAMCFKNLLLPPDLAEAFSELPTYQP